MGELQQLGLLERPPDQLHPHGEPPSPFDLNMGTGHHDSRQPRQVDIHRHKVTLQSKGEIDTRVSVMAQTWDYAGMTRDVGMTMMSEMEHQFFIRSLHTSEKLSAYDTDV